MKGKKAAFFEQYKIDRNQTQAAIRAGYSPKTAASAGCRLMKDPEIAAAVSEWEKQMHEQHTTDADEVIEFLTSVMRGEITDNVPLFIGKGLQELTKVVRISRQS